MSDYTSAPATTLLATHCACCGRELLDAVSVQVGIGPTCREKHGYGDGPTEHREAANALISAVARARHDVRAGKRETIVDVASKLVQLAQLGFTRCADHLSDALATVRVIDEGQVFAVISPWNEHAAVDLRTLRGRRWNKERKANIVPKSEGRALLAVLARHYAPCLAVGKKGPFLLEEVSQ